MAHVGKAYKLAFRRDLALNRPNDLGFAEAYTFAAGKFGSTLHPDVQDFIVRVVNVDRQAGQPQRWQSDFFLQIGRHWKIDWFPFVEPIDGLQTGTISIETVEDGIVWSATMKTASGTSTYNQWAAFEVKHLLTSTPLLHIQGPPYSFATSAVRQLWADYP